MNKSSASTTITLALPSFLQSEEFLFASSLSKKNCKPPRKIVSTDSQIGERILFDLMVTDQNVKPAYAALSALGNGFDPGNNWWLHVDPIELLVDAGNICLVGRDHLSLTAAESKQLLDTLNGLIESDNLSLLYGSSQEWYLKFSADPKILTNPLTSVIAKDIREFLPSGEQKSWWHKLMTEMQMLLFQHAINTQRQQQGKPIINSIWLWGEGSLDSDYPAVNYSAIWTNSALVRGLQKHAGSSAALYSLDEFDSGAIEVPGDYLIVCNHFYCEDRYPLLIDTLLDHFNRGKIQRLSIYTGRGEQYHWPSKRDSFLSRIFRKLG